MEKEKQALITRYAVYNDGVEYDSVPAGDGNGPRWCKDKDVRELEKEIADLREKLQNMRIRSDTFGDKCIDKNVEIDELKAERDDWKKRAYDLATFIDEQKLELALLDQTNMELKDASAQQKDIIEVLQHELVSAGAAIERKNYALEQAIIKLETINYPDIPFSRRKVIQLCKQAIDKTGEAKV